MNMLASECSSECESGWTLYLEHSFLNPNVSNGVPGFLGVDGGGSSFIDEYKQGKAKDEDGREEEEEEEEDLSMVSDASSGPPHFHDDDVYLNEGNVCFYHTGKPSTSAGEGKKMKKVKENQSLHQQKQLPSFLDDTASSPVFNITMNNIGAVTNVYQASNDSVQDFSQGFSTTYYDGRTSFQDHFDFLQPSPLSHNKLQKNQWFGGNGNETI